MENDRLPTIPQKQRLALFSTVSFLLLGIALMAAVVIYFPGTWITRLVALVGVLGAIVGIFNVIRPFKEALPALFQLTGQLSQNIIQILREWKEGIIQGIQRLIALLPPMIWKVILALWILSTTVFSIYNLAFVHSASSNGLAFAQPGSTCRDGPDIFHINQYMQSTVQENIGISDSTCYLFTTESR